MRVCLKCGDYYSDQLLSFCLADGTPLVAVDPSSDLWDEATRVIERKQDDLKRQRKLKWRRVLRRASAMLMTTIVIVTVNTWLNLSDPAGNSGGTEAKVCIGAFNDLNGNGVQDAGEPGLSGFAFQVSGIGPAMTVTTGSNGVVCADVPIGAYTVVEQPQSGWTATTPTTQTVTVTAGQTTNVFFGSRQERGEQERGKLCIGTFNDLNGNGVQDAGEPGLSEFAFQVNGTGTATTVTTGPNGTICTALPGGAYTVEEQPQSGWIATTPTTQTVTVTPRQAANVFFGSRQETGKLCIEKFNDMNGNRVRERNEPGLPGFVFQISGEAFATTITIGRDTRVCTLLPAGRYRVVEMTSEAGWIPTTETTQMTRVTADQPANLLFGSTRADPSCSESDKSREREIILDRCLRSWIRQIEAERSEIIAKAGIAFAEADLSEIKPEVAVDSKCAAALVEISYKWVVRHRDGKEKEKAFRGVRRFECNKMGGFWDCGKSRR